MPYKILIKDIRYLLTMTDKPLDHSSGSSILVEGKQIAGIYPAGSDLPQAEHVIDASHHLVMPGLVNCHHHFYQTLTRNLPAAANAKLFDWLAYLYDFWAAMTLEELHDASAIAAAELLLSGCTTALDHFYVFPNGDNSYFDAEVEGVRPTGLRLHLTRGSMSLSRKDGGLPPDSLVQSDREILNHTSDVVSRYHEPEDFGMLRVIPAPCSPFSVTETILRESAQLAAEKQLNLHTHLAETEDEERFCLEKFHVRPVEYMERVGWLTENTIFAHSVWVNAAEIQRYADCGCGIAYCPTSNMRLGSGIAPIVDMLTAGIKVGLGVDGSASNDSSHMIQEMRQALLLQRVKYGASAMSVRDVLRMATVGGARVLGREDIGLLKPGYAADIIGIDLDEIWYAGAQADPPGALVLCHTDRVDFSMVNGEVVVEHGRLARIDLDELIHKHNENAANLYNRVNNST